MIITTRPETDPDVPTDFLVCGEGNLMMLQPLTEPAKEWVREHLPSDAPKFGSAVAIEHRYAQDIVNGILDDGLTVE